MKKEKTWWEMKDLKKATGYSYGWLTQNILYKPCYKKYWILITVVLFITQSLEGKSGCL